MAPSAPAQRKRAVAPEGCRRLPPALVDHCLTSPIEIRLNCRVLGRRAPLRIQHRKGYAGSAQLVLERFQAKACPGLDPGWIPVRLKKTRQIRNPGPRFDAIETEKARGHRIKWFAEYLSTSPRVRAEAGSILESGISPHCPETRQS